jgi:hypothetical protein
MSTLYSLRVQAHDYYDYSRWRKAAPIGVVFWAHDSPWVSLLFIV